MERTLPPVFRGRDGRINLQILKPALRAFVIGYLSSTTPRFLSYLKWLQKNQSSHKRKLDEFNGTTLYSVLTRSYKLTRVLTKSIRFDGFPSFCALLVGGSTISPVLLYRLCASVVARFRLRSDILGSPAFKSYIQFIPAFLSSWFCFLIINKKRDRLQRGYGEAGEGLSRHELAQNQSENAQQQERRSPEFAGKSLDLTLFVFTRAADMVACVLWTRWRAWRKARNQWTFVESVVPKFSDAGVFAASCAVIMWAWFYLPDRLPRSYARWISEAANLDGRLLELLRRARRGEFVYGKDTGQAPFIQTMCEDYKLPVEWGDPAITIPLPCEVVHTGSGPSCEVHAASRFVRSFKFACATYLPLQFAVRFRKLKSVPAVIQTASGAMRSSAFLASFVTLFYYSVCLARTRLGPKIFDKNTVTHTMWDSGLCVGAGCLMCGWSILIEKPSRRREITLFVTPRAAATVLPRVYDRKYLYRERLAFAISAALLFTCLQERPRMVRGVFGKIATRILN